jgi:hypothetical protein
LRLRALNRKGRKEEIRVTVNLASSKVLAGFSQPRKKPLLATLCCISWKFVRKWLHPQENASGGARSAQHTRHTAVDRLHSIDFPVDKTAPFLLTLKIERVKTTSFFDSF